MHKEYHKRFCVDGAGDEFDEKPNKLNRKHKDKNNSDGEEYVVEGQEKAFFTKTISGEKNEYPIEDHSELVYADSKSHSFRFETHQDEEMNKSSELNKDNVPTYEMVMSAEDRTDPIYGVAHESDSSSKDEYLKRKEMRRMQKYGAKEFSIPKSMNYSNHQMYNNEPFPYFCAECYYKVDTSHVSWICRGHCGKVYHDRCKRTFEANNRNRNQYISNDHRDWICWMCREGKAE